MQQNVGKKESQGQVRSPNSVDMPGSLNGILQLILVADLVLQEPNLDTNWSEKVGQSVTQFLVKILKNRESKKQIILPSWVW